MPRKAQVHVAGQVHLRQRGPKGIWHARYKTPTGRVEQSLKVTNLRVAQKKTSEINELLDRDDFTTLTDRSKTKDITFATFWEEFKKNYTNWSPAMWQKNRACHNKLLAEFGPVPLRAINTRLIETYLARRRDQDGIAKGTVNRYLTALKAVFKMAVRWGYLGHDPAQPIKSLREENLIPEALTEDEFERMAAHLPPDSQWVAWLAVDTGMRMGEIERLAWSDVDLEHGSLIVRRQKKDEFRVIPMTRRVADLLTDLRQEMADHKVKDLKVLEVKNFARRLERAAEKAGLGHVHPHMLRHTFATRLRDRGVPLDRIKELLGHKSMDMVLRYAKARPEQLEDAIAALNG